VHISGKNGWPVFFTGKAPELLNALLMKRHSKQLIQLPASEDSSLLRLAYKNEHVINEEANASPNKKKTALKTKTPNKLFVKEPLPLFNDYRFKAKDHDPL
jgi:hypothetical protein